MKKDPTIHVTKSDLIRILERVCVFDGADDHRSQVEGLADGIFKYARNYQIRTRSIVVGTEAQRKKTTKRSAAKSPLSPERMLRILNAERVKHNHRTIAPIRQGDSAWTMLIEVARDAYEFAEQFDIVPRERGYHWYVDMGLRLIGKNYGINKFKYHKETIYARKGVELLIEQDPDKGATALFQATWEKIHSKHSSAVIKLGDMDRVHFIYGRVEAAKQKAAFAAWIQAQFDQLAFLNALPLLSQLYGDNAIKRYRESLLKKGRKKDDQVVHELPTESGGDSHDDFYQTLNRVRGLFE